MIGPVVLLLVTAACTPETADPGAGTTTPHETTTTSETTTTADPTNSSAPSTTTVPPAPPALPVVEIVGEPDVVFDWDADQCEPEHIPDISARAFRDIDGTVQLVIGHYVNYRMVGPTFDELETDCSSPIMTSAFDPDPSVFNDSEWIGGLSTADGETVYAVVHNEYRGDTHRAARPSQCPSRERFTCLDTSLTMAVSRDGGDTFRDMAPAPDHMIATLPYVFDDQGVPSGLRQPSNIIVGPDGGYYVFSNISDYPTEESWVCVMRSDDLEDPDSWRYWDGAAFTGVFLDPYRDEVGDDPNTCAPLDLPFNSAAVNEAVVYDESIGAYVMLGGQQFQSGDQLRWGVFATYSTDLVNWSVPHLVFDVHADGDDIDRETDLHFAYVSVMDHDSSSRTFDITDGSAYLYLTRFNAGSSSLDRDLLRWPIRIALDEVPVPRWEFDNDGDTEGWHALNGLEPLSVTGGVLTTVSVAEDPYLSSGPVRIPAEYGTVTLRMRVSGGGETVPAEFFFTRGGNGEFEGRSLLVFDVRADGEYHDYTLDLSAVPTWSDIIHEFRLDPVPDAGRTIDIDELVFSRS